MNATVIPEGFLSDSQGRLVPQNLVKPIDLARDELVKDLIARVEAQRNVLAALKTQALDDISAFVELSAEQYGANIGGKKGNVTLMSYDGRYKIQRQNAEYISFDERLQVAKALIDDCIKRWSEGSSSEIRVLVQDAFQTDKEGRINTARVLGLRRLDIQDQDWQQAMSAITDSIQTVGSKTYVRFYERIGDSDQWKPLSLDIAAL